MKKTLCLTSLLAIIAAGSANATETDVTFAGDYSLPDGTIANVASNVSGTSYTYEKTDGSDATAAYDEDPNLTYFTYTDKDGAAADLSSGTNLIQSDFTGTSAASGDIATTQEIVSGATADRANYTYVNGKGDTVELGTSAQSFTETHDLLSGVTPSNTYSIELANGYMTSVDVTDGATSVTSLDGRNYILHASNGQDYRLNEDGTEIHWTLDDSVVTDPATTLPTILSELTALTNAYADDTAAIATLVTNTGAWAATEATNFAAADTVFTTDSNTIAQLDTYYGTYQDALVKLDEANEAKANATAANAVNVAAQTAARDLYNAPIETTLASVEQNANAYTDAEATRATAAENTLQANIDTEASTRAADDATLQANINTEVARATTAENTLQANIDAEATTRAAADTDLQNKIDNEVARATAQEAAIRGEFAAADALTLSSANAYTDKKVDTLEKNVSGGVAAATALSAVSVSNVKKGEMSVGGGYGYYNNQSAMAFGAAMGLSDNWSINAGAGIASGDKTQVSFRAGTNYKFKLF